MGDKLYERQNSHALFYGSILPYFLLFDWFGFPKYVKCTHGPSGTGLLDNCIYCKCWTGWLYCKENKVGVFYRSVNATFIEDKYGINLDL